MYCPEHKVFGTAFVWVWMYWRDVPRHTIPLRVWLNPLNYEVNLYWPPTYKADRRRKLVTINRNGQWVRSRIWRMKRKVRKALGMET